MRAQKTKRKRHVGPPFLPLHPEQHDLVFGNSRFKKYQHSVAHSTTTTATTAATAAALPETTLFVAKNDEAATGKCEGKKGFTQCLFGSLKKRKQENCHSKWGKAKAE